MKGLYFIVATFLFTFPSLLAQTDSGVLDVDGDQGACEPLTNAVCSGLGYTMTYFPNFREHETQASAGLELIDYWLLIQSQCSDFILQFLCAFYLPICYTSSITNLPKRLRPCRSLCEAARQNCSQVLEENGFTWPEFLECSLDTFPSDGTTCFGEDQSSEDVTDSESDSTTSDVTVAAYTTRDVPTLATDGSTSTTPSFCIVMSTVCFICLYFFA